MTNSVFSNLCLACANPVKRIAFAVVAPWIGELSGNDKPQMTALATCEQCQFSFFEKRFSDDEMAAMYSGYRSDRYYKVRNSWEPWYGRSVNDAFSDSSGHLDERVSFMTSILTTSGLNKCTTVVDFGGDEGQFFPTIEIENRIVIDVSNKPLRRNVVRAPSLEDVSSDIDLIVAAHIAEHVNEPVDFFRGLISHLKSGSHLYIEVPLDKPSVKKFHATAKYEEYLKAVSSGGKKKFVVHDFVSGVARQLGKKIPRRGIVKQSEHLNYYNLQSLSLIVEGIGCTVVNSESLPNAKVGGLRLGRLGVLVVKN
jgi:hypothetical protein